MFPLGLFFFGTILVHQFIAPMLSPTPAFTVVSYSNLSPFQNDLAKLIDPFIKEEMKSFILKNVEDSLLMDLLNEELKKEIFHN